MNKAVFVAWRSGGDSTGHWGPVGRLERIDSGYRFVYTEGARLLPGFHPLPGFNDFEAIYESDELFPLFANRLLAPKRPEYQQYLKWNGLDPTEPPDPLALLGITEGRRATDQLEILPCPHTDSEGCYLTKFFLHGIRWMTPQAIERVNALQTGDTLSLMIDVNNPVDGKAIAVRSSDPSANHILGYVPRYLAGDLLELCLSCDPQVTQLSVLRLNMDAPLQFRLLCRFRGCWPPEFIPCSDALYWPIPELSSEESFIQS